MIRPLQFSTILNEIVGCRAGERGDGAGGLRSFDHFGWNDRIDVQREALNVEQVDVSIVETDQ